MNFKWTVPYLLFGAMLLCEPYGSDAHSKKTEKDTDIFKKSANISMPENFIIRSTLPYNTTFEQKLNDFYLDIKADSLCDAYVANMLRAQAKLNPLLGKRGYNAAVRAELPGAPVGQHCVWGQHTQLSRALNEMGDTLTIIPRGARTACIQFKHHMRGKYQTPEYKDCIHDGKIHESDSAYNVALNKYLAQNNAGTDTSAIRYKTLHNKFALRNFSADSIDSGTILIVPRFRGSRNTFHAIMYLGRGRIENGKFVADTSGRHIYTGHNRENIGDLFKTYDTSNVFAANTRKIARAEYAKELKRIESMSTDELIKFIADKKRPEQILNFYSHDMLMRMARDKYFNREPLATKHPIFPNTTNINSADDIMSTAQRYLLKNSHRHTL